MQNRQGTRGPVSKGFASLIWVIVFVGWAFLGGIASAIKGDPIGSSSSSTACGPYSLRNDTSDVERIADDMLQGEKESRAGDYAKDCYTDHVVTDVERCNFFYNQSIGYSMETVPCPFADISYCRESYNAVRFYTPLVDSEIIGLNADIRPKFRRSTTCVPLSMRPEFVDPYWYNDQLQVDYYWGPINRLDEFTPYTFRQFGEPFKWGITAYALK